MANVQKVRTVNNSDRPHKTFRLCPHIAVVRITRMTKQKKYQIRNWMSINGHCLLSATVIPNTIDPACYMAWNDGKPICKKRNEQPKVSLNGRHNWFNRLDKYASQIRARNLHIHVLEHEASHPLVWGVSIWKYNIKVYTYGIFEEERPRMQSTWIECIALSPG